VTACGPVIFFIPQLWLDLLPGNPLAGVVGPPKGHIKAIAVGEDHKVSGVGQTISQGGVQAYGEKNPLGGVGLGFEEGFILSSIFRIDDQGIALGRNHRPRDPPVVETNEVQNDVVGVRRIGQAPT
jgi:hypothetical protein